jgi:hypothetical protein
MTEDFRILTTTDGRHQVVKCFLADGVVVSRQVVGTYKRRSNAEKALASWRGEDIYGRPLKPERN